MTALVEDLTPAEREVIRAVRAAQSGRGEPLPQLTRDELRARLRSRVGLGDATIHKTVAYLTRATRTYPGPTVTLTGTLQELQATWEAHEEHLVAHGKSGDVIRHHREAIARYCKAAGIPWEPEASAYERRSRIGRARAADAIELPPDFIDRIHAVIHDVRYHKDPAVNAMFQTRARVAFKTAPRVPSEDGRLRLQDVHAEQGVIIYRQSKIAGPEGGVVLVPRHVWGVPRSLLQQPTRKSIHTWLTSWRPKLEATALHRFGPEARTDLVWLGPEGVPYLPDKYRQIAGALGKSAWPAYYPYLAREVGIIMRALQMHQERGHFDLELLIQWSGHDKVDTLRRYLRQGRALLRAAGTGTDVRDLLRAWEEI